VSSRWGILKIASVLGKLLIRKRAVAIVPDDADDHQEEKDSRGNAKETIACVTRTPNQAPDEGQHRKKPVSGGDLTDKQFPNRLRAGDVRATEGSGKERGTIHDEEL
jgi:hypothetical protein